MTSYQLDSGRRTAANVVGLAGTALALLLTAHILFVLFGARPDSAVVAWVATWSDVVGLWFTHLFATTSPAFTVILDYGCAAVFWLVVTGLVARVLRRVG